MLKMVKDVRRRVVETTLGTVGKSERTHDEELDQALAAFHKTIEELNKTGASLTQAQLSQRQAFNEAAALAAMLYRSWIKHSDVPDNVKEVSMRLNDSWNVIDEVLRPSTDVVSLERALKPISQHVSTVVPEVDEAAKQRENTVVDYDSYRRRLKTKETERDAAEAERVRLESEGKPSKSTDAIKAEVTKFMMKVTNAENALSEQTAHLKTKVREAELTHKQLLFEAMLVTLVVQEELFTRSALQLRSVIDSLPPEFREQANAIRQDAFSKVEKAAREKSMVEKLVALEDRRLSLLGETPGGGGNPFVGVVPSGRNDPPASEVDPSKSMVPSKPSEETDGSATDTPRVLTVTALYDNVAESEDELSFSAGDVIEVLDMGEDGSGWGRGRLGFNEGLFPLNFVQHNS